MRHALLILWLAVAAVAAPNDACLICDGAPGTATREVVIHGRVVPLCDHPSCEAEVRRDPKHHLAPLSPRSALFRGEMDFERRPAWTAFALGLAALAAVVALAVVTHRRLSASAPDGEGPPGLARIPSTPSPVRCASCAAENHPSAVACTRCHAALQPSAQSEVGRA